MEVPRDIRRSDPSFGDSWAKCSYEANLPNGEFDKQLKSAVISLRKAGPNPADRENEIERFPINPEYHFAYVWAIDRDKQGRAIFYHLGLLLVLRS